MMKEISVDTYGPIVTRSDVEKHNDYHDYRDNLRYDFCCSCAYCSITELEASAVRFEIDHYHPQKHFPDLIKEYNNLFWSCETCNHYKSDYFPNDEDIEGENTVIRIDNENPQEHLEVEGDIIHHKTNKGEFNKELLYLNRLNLRRLRSFRRRFWDASEYLALGIHKIRTIKLDEMPTPRQRIKFMGIKDQINKKYDNIQNYLKELPVCSAMIETDTQKKKNLKRRKEYLKAQKAIKGR
jgi:uncharacterized protein (TIGR02646 family)